MKIVKSKFTPTAFGNDYLWLTFTDRLKLVLGLGPVIVGPVIINSALKSPEEEK
tara:strand:- start:2936 stop:3097 length:162 start_codon:yes stop_codon:yes gene_type:complete